MERGTLQRTCTPWTDLFVIELAAERFVLNESSLLGKSRIILPPPPQGVSEEVVVDVVEHTLTKNFLKKIEISQEFEVLYSSSKIWQMRTSSNVGPVGS
jgi:hypothetical protein